MNLGSDNPADFPPEDPAAYDDRVRDALDRVVYLDGFDCDRCGRYAGRVWEVFLDDGSIGSSCERCL